MTFKTHCSRLLMTTGSNMEAYKPLLPSLNPLYKHRGNASILAYNITPGPCTGNTTPRPLF